MQTYRVTLVHPDLSGPFVADVLATSPKSACSRIAGSAVHHFRHAELLDAYTKPTGWRYVLAVAISEEEYETHATCCQPVGYAHQADEHLAAIACTEPANHTTPCKARNWSLA